MNEFFSMEQASDAKVLIISVAARMAGMHPQTLRQYDRLGLVQPGRAAGGGRRYSVRDVALLREIQRLSQEDGVNLAGIKRIIELEQLTASLQQRVAELEAALDEAYQQLAQLTGAQAAGPAMEAAAPYPRGDLVPTARTSTALVVWRPRRGSDRGGRQGR
jgi:MerR family transcriptional regulator/heat shock protein HspR